MASSNRPGVVTALGVLNIVFGVLWLLLFICAGAGFAFFSAMMNQAAKQGQPAPNILRMYELINQEVPSYYTVVAISSVTNIVLTFVLLISGVGLLRMRPWARQACIIYAVVNILAMLGYTAYSVATVEGQQRGTMKWQEELRQQLAAQQRPGAPPVPPPTQPNTAVTIATSLIGLLFLVVYSVILLSFMLSSKVKAALSDRRADDELIDRRDDPDDRGDYR
jgi:hypothetical protein